MLMNILKSSFIVFLFCSFVYGDINKVGSDDVEVLYENIIKKSNSVFSHKKLDFTINSHVGVRNLDDITGDKIDPFASISFSVPFSSKSERIGFEKSKLEQIEKASLLVKTVRGNRKRIRKLNEKIKMLEPILNDGGVVVVNEYFKSYEEVEMLNEEIESNIRILEYMAK